MKKLRGPVVVIMKLINWNILITNVETSNIKH